MDPVDPLKPNPPLDRMIREAIFKGLNKHRWTKWGDVLFRTRLTDARKDMAMKALPYHP